jgi:hypothetical protein
MLAIRMRAAKTFEAEPGSRNLLGGSMFLLDNVVGVLDLAQFNEE